MEKYTVTAFAAVWLEDVRARAHPKTLERYEKEFRYYIEPDLGSRALEDVTRRDLKRLVAQHAARGLNPAMLIRVLSNFFAAALEEGQIAAEPARRLWRHVRKGEGTLNVRAFTKGQLALFLHVSTGERLYADLFRTMAFSGLRVGEARALVASDVHPEARKLDVRRTFSGEVLSSSTKTREARRIEIPRELAELLGRRARGRHPSAWLFDRNGEPLREKAVSEAFRRIVKRAELPRHHGTHSLRHTYASNLIQQGVPIVYVQRQLGHKSIKQTVDVYGRWLPLSQTGELERLVVETREHELEGEFTDEGERGGEQVARLLRFPVWIPTARPGTSCSPTSADDEEPEGAA